ncbi:enoyl-CoA hydratase/isomerase family protein [Pararhodonellum marinum]|uniref:enoyl-CoA hydratase/isomerase family protein n=1 Tax=Pararhodonellum marinum TaxID=2755358 RepID=UPI00188FC246|nr:enoyl-CoA hydratase-related protein [Pararhodonellum marinum]
MEPDVKIEIKDRIGYVTLNWPEKRNALNPVLIEKLKSAFTKLKNNDEAKVLVLKAEGKVFCAGADLGYIQKLQDFSYEENLEDSQNLKELFHRIYSYPKVVIAQIQGHALAGGSGLATVCDFSFSVPEAKFGFTEVKIGFLPALVSVFLLRKVGEGITRTLLLEAEVFEAAKAKSYGLINEVVPAVDLEKTVYDFAQKLIKQNSGDSMAMTKKMLAMVQEKSLYDGLEYASIMNAKARSNPDCKKGIAAFLNKQEIQW